jgi:hypothetical protein
MKLGCGTLESLVEPFVPVFLSAYLTVDSDFYSSPVSYTCFNRKRYQFQKEASGAEF